MRVKRFLAGVLSASMLSMMCAGTLTASASANLVGDVDGSGHVNPGDSIEILNVTSGMTDTAFAPEIADVNLDGVINESDAAAIAAYYMGKIDALPAEAPITVEPADPFPHEFSFSMGESSGYAGTTIPVNIYLDQSKDYSWLYELEAMRLSVAAEESYNIKVSSVYMNASFWIGNTDGNAVISGAYVKDDDITKPVATVYLEVGADVPEGTYAVDFVAEDCFIGNIFGQTADQVSFTGGKITVNTAPETLPTTVATTMTTTTTSTTTTTTACATETTLPEDTTPVPDSTDYTDETTIVTTAGPEEETTETTVITTSGPIEETDETTIITTSGPIEETDETTIVTTWNTTLPTTETTIVTTWNTTMATTNMTTTTWLTTFPTTDMTTTTIASTLDENGEVIYGTTMPADTTPSGSDSEEEPIETTTSEISDDGTGTDWVGSDEVNGTTAVASDADTTETTTAFTEIAPEEPAETEASTEIAPEETEIAPETSETTETIASDEAATETTEPAETLPQTGNPAWFSWMIALAAMLVTAGGWMMMQSGMFRKDGE